MFFPSHSRLLSLIATRLISATGYDTAPGAYLAFAALLSAFALFLMQDRSRQPLR